MALNGEIRALFAAGADIVQLDEPFLQAQPDKARRFGFAAINRAIEGVAGTTALHLCFGYAARVAEKPSGYSFLPELEGANVQQVSVEAAQPKLDPAVLGALPNKQVMVGVIDLGDMNVETPQVVAGRLRAALRHVPAERLIAAPDCGMKYLPRAVAYAKMCAMVEGARIVRAELQGEGAADLAANLSSEENA